MTPNEQKIYAEQVESNAIACATELAEQVDKAPCANQYDAMRAAIKLAYIRGAQWAMHDAQQTLSSKRTFGGIKPIDANHERLLKLFGIAEDK